MTKIVLVAPMLTIASRKIALTLTKLTVAREQSNCHDPQLQPDFFLMQQLHPKY